MKLAETQVKLKGGDNNTPSDGNDDDVSVMLMADLQEEQTKENNALLQAMQQSVMEIDIDSST